MVDVVYLKCIPSLCLDIYCFIDHNSFLLLNVPSIKKVMSQKRFYSVFNMHGENIISTILCIYTCLALLFWFDSCISSCLEENFVIL